MKNFKQLRSTQITEATSAEKNHAAALAASEKAKASPSALNHRAAADAHEKAIDSHEKAVNSLIKKDGSADEVKQHEAHIKMHRDAAQKHRFNAHRLSKAQQNEGTVTETNWKVTFKHKHPDGEKEHSYTVSAPHQNAADKKAIELHRKAHPKGDFHMWNSEELYEEGLKDACWKGYEAIGTKQKNGKTVPNCVPKEGAAEDAQAAHQAAHAALDKGDAETYNKELDKKFAIHSAEAEKNAKKPVKTFEAFTPNQGVLAQIKKDHEELKGMATKDVHRVHQGQYRVKSSYTPAEVGGKQGMISDILRNRHGDKHVSHYFGLKEMATTAALPAGSWCTPPKSSSTEDEDTTIEKPVAEKSDEQKNLKITKHEKAAVEAGKRGDKQAQQYHLELVKKLQNESVINEAAEPEKLPKHLVTVTVSDPHHTMASKRKEKIMKRVKVSAEDPKAAVKKAEAHYKKHGFKVHDSLHHSVVTESLDTDEFVDSYDPETDDNADEAARMSKAQLKEIIDMAQDLVDAMEDDDVLEPWMQYKITSANKDLDDVYSTIAYGEDDDEDSSENDDEDSETDETEKN